MKKILSLLSLMLGLILVSSCTSKKISTDSTQVTLLDSNWQFIELGNVAISKEVNGTVPYLTFDKAEKRYSAITGCNTVNGTLEENGDKLKFGLGMSTMMFCEDMSVENGFKQILENIKTYKISGNQLVLYGDNDKVLAKLNKYSK